MHAIMSQHLTCVVSRDTKEDKGKSMMQALYILQLAKRHACLRTKQQSL